MSRAVKKALEYVADFKLRGVHGHPKGDEYSKCLIDGASRRVEWLKRHRIVSLARHDRCPCLIGTKRQKCDECKTHHYTGRHYLGACWAGREHNCGWRGELFQLSDHYRTWTRDGVNTIFTTEPYGLGADQLDALVAWGARKGVSAFVHSSDESFHYPGRTDLIAIMPLHAADEYARLEPTAVRCA